jgi:hypothetical protein
MNASRGLLAGFVLCALALYGQNKAPATNPKAAAKPAAFKPTEKYVYFRSWDDGELKDCDTFPGQIQLLICDGYELDWDGSLINMLGHFAGLGLTDKEGHDEAFGYIDPQQEVCRQLLRRSLAEVADRDTAIGLDVHERQDDHLQACWC